MSSNPEGNHDGHGMHRRRRWRRGRRRDGHHLVALTMADLLPGQRAVVHCIEGEGPLVQRMMQMGLLEGTQIEMVRRAPAGDPIEFHILGYSLSLRACEARSVTIREVR